MNGHSQSVTSPHVQNQQTTAQVMLLLLLALVPGILAQAVFFSWGNLVTLVWACILAVSFETAVLYLRKRPVLFYLQDYSAIVTAVLLAIALPHYAPWWLTLIGVFFAIVIAKHLYGGLGQNVFNPAMVAYVVLLIAFPAEMSRWATPRDLLGDASPGLWQTVQIIFTQGSYALDGFTAATPLDTFKFRESLTTAEVWQRDSGFGYVGGYGWEWVNLGFLFGGLFLLYKKIYTWHAPLSMLATLAICSLLFYGNGGSDSAGSPLFHLFSGATMLGAFFIVTDPVSCATSRPGRIIFGASVGLLVFIIRTWGNYPDAVAFAVLLMNICAPLIDYYVQPRSYGHKEG